MLEKIPATIDVVIVAYNAEKYVAQAIESVLEQQLEIPYRVLVSDDSSTDKTGNMIARHVKKYPDKIFHYRNHENIGTYSSLQNILTKCNAKYIALLEGDDNWSNPEKLRIQLDFLQKNKTFVACAGLSKVYNEVTERFEDTYNKHPKTEYELKDLFGIPPFQIGTLVFRRAALESLPDIFKGTISNDKIVYTLLAKHGPIYCFDQVFSVYRKHDSSISKMNTREQIYEHQERLYDAMKTHFGTEWKAEIERAKYVHFRAFFRELIRTNKSAIALFPKFLGSWFRLGEWKTINGWKDFFYLSFNLLP